MKLLAILLITAVGSTAAMAQPRSIDARQHNQYLRIDAGRADGSLTPREARRLDWAVGSTQRLENRLAADGRFGRYERLMVQRRLDATSAAVYRNRRDWQHW
jgi:hypothetical protein